MWGWEAVEACKGLVRFLHHANGFAWSAPLIPMRRARRKGSSPSAEKSHSQCVWCMSCCFASARLVKSKQAPTYAGPPHHQIGKSARLAKFHGEALCTVFFSLGGASIQNFPSWQPSSSSRPCRQYIIHDTGRPPALVTDPVHILQPSRSSPSCYCTHIRVIDP